MPIYQISAPDGNTYRIDGPAGATDDQVRAEVLKQHPTAGTAKGGPHPVTGEVVAGVKELGKGLARGAIETFGAFTGSKPEEAQRIERRLGLESSDPGLSGKAGEFVGGMAAMPGGVEAIAPKTLGGQAPRLAQRATARAEAAAQPAVTAQTVKAAGDAHLAGITLTPRYVGGAGRQTVAGLVGADKLSMEASAENVKHIDRLAKLGIGLKPEEELSTGNIERLKEGAYKAYEAIRRIGQLPADPEYQTAVANAGGRFAQRGPSYGGGYHFESVAKAKEPYLQARPAVDASETVDEIRALRKLGSANLKNYDPEKNALGLTQREIADAMERRIGRYLESQARQGDTQARTVLSDFTQARQQLAKIHVVEDTLGAGNHVRASDYALLLDKGAPLTGTLRIIADTAKHFPKDVAFVAEKGQTGGWSPLDYLLGGTGIVTGHPAAAVPALLRPVARAALLAESGQTAQISKLGQKPGPVKRAATAVAKSPYTKAAAVSAARQAITPDSAEE